jgi:hypothetical protein
MMVKTGFCRTRCIVAVNILAQEYQSLDLDFLNQIQNGGEQFAAFFLFMGTSPKDYALLGGNGNTLKLKTTAKISSKQTSIATALDIHRMYATFLTPLGSHYRLPFGSYRQQNRLEELFFLNAESQYVF